MAIGRISGPLLKANLIRNGVDLAFENDLLYLDVSDPNPANHKIGIKNSNPAYALDVTGTIQASAIITPNFAVEDLIATKVSSDLIPTTDEAYVLGTPAKRWKSLDVSKLTVDAFQIQGNTLSVVDSSADIELRPNGTGTVAIVTDTALRLPYGSELARPAGVTAQIRFNTDNSQFEGFNGLGWVSLGATRDIDGNTRITAELQTGANDNTFRFYNDGTLTGVWDVNQLAIHKVVIDDTLVLDTNVITTKSSNTDLVLQANGTGKISIPTNNLDVDNNFNVDGITTLNDTTVDGSFTNNGTSTITDVHVTNDLTVDGNIFGDYLQTNDIQVSGTVITTTVGNSNLQLRAAGTGEVRVEENLTVTGNTVLNGDLQIDGQDLTSSTTTFNLVNTIATSVNFAGAATAIEIGASTGVTSINNSLTVDGNLTVGNASTDTVLLNANTVEVPNQVTFNIDDSVNTFTGYPVRVRHTTSGTPANGIGTGIQFVTETGSTVNKIGMTIEATAVDTTSATEDFDFVVRLMDDGNLVAERFRVSSVGNGTLVGNLAVNGGTISTISSTANVVNTNATQVNIAGAGTNVQIGSATGTTNINNNLDVDGNVNIDGGTLSVTTTTFNIADTTATTVNAFGAATTLNIGADIGTTTLRNDLIVDGGITVNNDQSIRFKESAANGNEWASIQAPESLTESYVMKLPTSKGNYGQILSTDGNGQMQWAPADTLVGNRFYVSAAYGDDSNNGFDAPVKTIKRAAELMNETIYSPKRTVAVAEKDTKAILLANKDYLKAQVTGFIDNNYAFVYNSTKCARDTGLIVQSVAFDLLFDGNTQSTFAGLQYWVQAAKAIPEAQKEETVLAIQHAKALSMAVVENTAITKQIGNVQDQIFDLVNPGTSTEAAAIGAYFDTIVSIINGNTNISGSIINNGLESTNPNVLNAFALLQSNKLFIQDDTIAYIDNNFAFVYPEETCERDTGLIVQSLAFDALYEGNSQTKFAALQYWSQDLTPLVGPQSDETIGAIAYAKTVAQQVVQNIAIPPTPGNTTPQVFDLLNPGSGAGSTIIGLNFDRVLDIVDGRPSNISDTIVNNGPVSTSNSILNTNALLLANKAFIRDEVLAFIDQNYNFTYDSVKCERDTGLIVDAASYDLALGTNFNAVKAGQAYQRANVSNGVVKSTQLVQTVAALNYAKTQAATATAGNSTAQTRSNAAFAEIIDILENGVVNSDALVYPAPTGTPQDTIDAVFQLRQNRSFLQAEVVAFVNANSPPLDIDTGICGRDTGYIVDALCYDLIYGGNSATIQAATAYFIGAVAVIDRAYDISKTIDAYNRLKSVITDVVQGLSVSKTPGNAETQITTGGVATSSEATTLTNLIEIINFAIDNDGSVPSTVYPGLLWVDSGILDARDALLAAKSTIVSGTTSYIATNYQSLAGTGYDAAARIKCGRDVEYIVESVGFDLTHGGNRQSTQAGVYYYNYNGSTADSVIPTERPQTSAAYTYLKSLVQAVLLNQEPSTRYQTLVSREPGTPVASNASVLSALNTDIDLIINVITNGPSIITTTSPISSTPTTNADNIKAFGLLRANEAFIAAELTGFIKATFSSIAGYDKVKCKRDTGYIVDSVSFDLKYGGNRQSIQSGIYYYANSTTVSVIPNQRMQEIAALTYLKSLVTAVVTEGAYTPLQGVVTQDTSGTPATSIEAGIINADIDRIINIIQNGPGVAEARQSIGLTPVNNADIENAYAQLLANEEFIKAEVVQYVNDSFTGLVYNKATCSRDVGYMIDAVVYDMEYGGNAKSIYAGEIYYNGTTSAEVVINQQKAKTAASIEHLRTVARNVIRDEDPTVSYSDMFRIPVSAIPGITTTVAERATQVTAIQASLRIISDTLSNGVGYVRPINYGDGYYAATGNIFVASGDYVEDNPLIIPDNVSVIGADLRSVIIRPKNSKKDMFRMRNGSYMSGFTWRDAIDPITRKPQFTWDYATTFDNIADASVTRGSYPSLPLTKPLITQSPYIQNVSIISFLGGSGALIDGNLVVTPNYPAIVDEAEVAFNQTTPGNFIPEQGKSMVANAYTMVSFGGVGWKLINDAYAQIVSCFQIFLLEGVVCQSGGYCSITNSATNFGLYALRASGYSPNAFTFDRGIICATGVASGAQTLTTIGTKRTPVNEFVIRIRTQDEANDITNNYLTPRDQFIFDPTTIVDPVTDIFTSNNHGIANKQKVTYYTNGGTAIGGLQNGQNYYVYQIDINQFKLYFDETLTIPMDITSVGSGGSAGQPAQTPRHTFAFVVEEFFVRDIKETHNTFQTLVLANEQGGFFEFEPGTTITGTTVVQGYANPLPNNAYVYSYNQTTRELVVGVNLVTVNLVPTRVKFNATSIIDAEQSPSGLQNLNVDEATDRADLWAATFTISSTVTNSLLQSVVSLPGFHIWFHRPSIVNSSSHTWEYAGSGIDYNALPQNGGQTREEYEQFTEEPGRVYTSGTNELGDFKVGNFIVAENKTGNISFRNEVTVGQLNALRLSLSDIEINKISNDPGLGDNEPGGASDSALITQLSIRTFIANRLGQVVDKRVSTNANAGALVQLNSSGQINKDLIPPLRTTNSVTTVGFNSRLELSEDQPAVDVLSSDTVVEIYQFRSLTLSGNITVVRGQTIKQANSGAFGEVVNDVTAGNVVVVADIVGTFTEDNAADFLTDASNVSLGGAYPTTIGPLTENQVPYVLTIDTISQFLVLYNLVDGNADYNFATNDLVSATINTAIGQVKSYKYGVVNDLQTLSYNKGSGYIPSSGSATYLNVPLTNNTGTGTGAIADITVVNGQVSNVDLRRGGTGYAAGNILSASNTNLGGSGVGFNINVVSTEQRLYVDLVDGVKFIGTTTVPDFIADLNAPIKTITSLTTSTVKTFNADDISASGNVDYATSRITIATHGYANGDPVLYSSGLNTVISPLINNKLYHVKVIDSSTIELYLDYALVTKVLFTTSSTGNHTLTVLPANYFDDIFYIAAHGFTTGDPVELAGANVPAGLTAPRYYVGSVTANAFTLHILRIDALASINGLSINKANFTTAGTGSMTFTKQNVQIIGNINTSSNIAESYSVLSTTNVDAANIISGIINTSRLGSGAANSDSYLRGDSTWHSVIQSLRPTTGSPISLSGSFTTVAGVNYYYGDTQVDIVRASDLLGDTNWTNTGIASFSKGQFEVSSTGQVAVKSGKIDAISLGGLQASYFLDPTNLTSPVPVTRGGTGINSLPTGSMLYGSTAAAAATLAIGSANTILVSNGTEPTWSANLSLTGNLVVNGETTIGNASTDAFTIVSDTALVNNSLTFEQEDGLISAVSYPVSFRHTVTGSPVVGIGTGVQFITETSGNNFEIGSIIESVTTDITGLSEDFDFVVKTMYGGGNAAQVLKLNNTTVQVGASNTATTLTTNGTGNLTINTNSGTNAGSIVLAQGVNGNITITPNGTGTVNIGKTTNITGDLTVTGTTSIGGVFLTAASVTGLTILSTVDTFNKTIYRSAKFQVQITCTAGPDNGNYQTTEILVIHNGTTAYMTEYGVLKTGSNELATFTVDISGDDVRLRVTPTASDTLNIKVVRTAQPL